MQIPGLNIRQQLGQGRTGTVHLAVETSPERTWAVKILHPHLAGHPAYPARLRETLGRLARVHHPGVVTIHDIAVPGEVLYLVMEYLPGGSVAQRLEEGLFLGEALNLIRDVSAALAEAHRKGVVHGCLTPANVLFRMDGSPVLTDFGVRPDPAREVAVADDLRQLGVFFKELLLGGNPAVPLPAELERFQPLLAALEAAGGEGGYGRVEDFRRDLERAVLPGGPVAVIEPPPVPVEPDTVVDEPAAAEVIPPGQALLPAPPLPARTLQRQVPGSSMPPPLPRSRGRRRAVAAAILLPLVLGAAFGAWSLSRQPAVSASATTLEAVPADEPRPVVSPPPDGVPRAPAIPPVPEVQEVPQEEGGSDARPPALAEESLAGFEPVPESEAEEPDSMETLAEEIRRDLALAALTPGADPRNGQGVNPSSGDAISQEARIARLKARFETLLGDWQLSTGRNGHALGVLEEIRRLDPEHPFLAEGRRRIATAYANLARAALDRGELKYARRWIKRGERIEPLPFFVDLGRELEQRYRILAELSGEDPRHAPATAPQAPRNEPGGAWKPHGIRQGETPFGWQSR